MPDFEKSLEYLERAIRTMALATQRGQKLLEEDGYWGATNATYRNRLFAYCIRRATKHERAEWKRLADNLTKCGVEHVEKRAAELSKMLRPMSLFAKAALALMLVGLIAAAYFAIQAYQ